MQPVLKIKNINIIGKYNLTTYDRFFFIKNNIFKEDEILGGSSFSNSLCRIITPSYSIHIDSDRLVVNCLDLSAQDISNKIAASIVEKSEVNPYAIGINYSWFYVVEDEKALRKLSREWFYNKNDRLHSGFFDTDDTHYGMFLSKDYEDSRLKLEIRSVRMQEVKTGKTDEALNFSFNFHSDLKSGKSNEDVLKYLAKDPEFFAESKRIVSLYNN